MYSPLIWNNKANTHGICKKCNDKTVEYTIYDGRYIYRCTVCKIPASGSDYYRLFTIKI